jgi:putative ABC transport system permease protein
LALLSGTLVLGGAVAAGHRERTRDAVLLKVLGATRADIARTFLIENAIIGALCALLAGGAGTLIARIVVARMFRTDWEFFLAPVFGTALFAILLSLSLGFAATLRALGKRPAAYLRGE